MRDVLDDLDRWQRQSEQVAIATLTEVRGSAPRLPGARFCATRSGEVSGSVSGGCIEADLFEHAMQVLDGERPAVVQYGISDELAFEVGLSCGGEIEVLVEPFRSDAVWEALREALIGQRSAVLAVGLEPTSIAARRMVVFEDGATTGSIGADLDGAIAEQANGLLQAGGTRRLTLGEPGEGRVVFLEAFRPPPHLFLLGAAFAGPPLARMASEAGFHVTVVDPRSAFATRERFPSADELIVGWPNEAIEAADLGPHAYIVMLLHDEKFDVPALVPALRSEAGYIGVMGSRRTHERRLEQLREQGCDDEALSRLRAPIGLDIGGREPAEIAVSILAEMLAVRYGRDPRGA
ncbi:MAG: XdhC family protein [Chloroflexi bacterium]|nr:XdhC family protein [Chloroflexota bacterium]